MTRYILVVSPMSTLPNVMKMRSLVTHTLNPVKEPWTRSLPTPLISSFTCLELIARNLQKILVVNDQEDGDQAIEMCKTFYDTVLDDPNDGGRH